MVSFFLRDSRANETHVRARELSPREKEKGFLTSAIVFTLNGNVVFVKGKNKTNPNTNPLS